MFRRFFSKLKESSLPSCPGCGAVFQYTQKQRPGFLQSKLSKDPLITPEKIKFLEALPILTQAEASILIKHKKEKIVKCTRCTSPQKSSPTKYPVPEKLYAPIKTSSNNTILHVASVLDYQHTLNTIQRYVGTASIIIPVINKIDLINPSAQPIITQQLKKLYPQAPSFISAKLGLGIKELVDRINEHKSSTVHVIGHTNVGKSALTNAFLELAGRQKQVTVHNGFGTTIGPITIPTDGMNAMFTSASSVIDTPGLETPGSHAEFLQKPLLYRGDGFKEGESLLIDNVCRVDVLNSELKLSYFGNRNILLTKCWTRDVGKSAMDNDAIEQLFHVKKSALSWDLCIPGVGWVTVKSTKDIGIRVYTQGKVVLRKSILKLEHTHPLNLK